MTPEDRDIVERAIVLATTAHRGQPYGDLPYIAHPLAVGLALLSAGATAETVAGGLLHDAPEDTDISAPIITSAFGSHVGNIVDQLRHAAAEPYRDYSMGITIPEAKAIKVVDSAHNLLTLPWLDAPADKIERLTDRYQRNIGHHVHALSDLGLTFPGLGSDLSAVIVTAMRVRPEGWNE